MANEVDKVRTTRPVVKSITPAPAIWERAPLAPQGQDNGQLPNASLIYGVTAAVLLAVVGEEMSSSPEVW